MKSLRDAQTILATLEDGDAIAALGEELINTLVSLKEHAGESKNAKVKGSVTLKLNIIVNAGTATIEVDLSSKRPKPDRGTSFFWVLDDGSLTTEHPKQANLFDGPREVTTRAIS